MKFNLNAFMAAFATSKPEVNSAVVTEPELVEVSIEATTEAEVEVSDELEATEPEVEAVVKAEQVDSTEAITTMFSLVLVKMQEMIDAAKVSIVAETSKITNEALEGVDAKVSKINERVNSMSKEQITSMKSASKVATTKSNGESLVSNSTTEELAITLENVKATNAMEDMLVNMARKNPKQVDFYMSEITKLRNNFNNKK
jgi:hypothetical protein